MDVSVSSGVPPHLQHPSLEEIHWMEGTMPHWRGGEKPYLGPLTLPEVLALVSGRIMGDWLTGPEGSQDYGAGACLFCHTGSLRLHHFLQTPIIPDFWSC